MRKTVPRVVTAVILLMGLAPGADLRLKTGNPPSHEDSVGGMAGPPRRRAWGRTHLIVRFAEPPPPEHLLELVKRGAVPLKYVPDSGFLTSADDGAELSGLGVVWAGPLRAWDKLSPLLVEPREDPARGRDLVVEFHEDVDREDARALLEEHGFVVGGHPRLHSNHWLVRGDLTQAVSLARWDEVAYVFPASEELLLGQEVEACPGALTAYGTVGQYVAQIGEGWDGPGQNAAVLGYHLGPLTSRLDSGVARAEILRALAEWSRHVQVDFQEAGGPFDSRTLRILFTAGAHDDPFPFDGPGRVLAHTFYPAPPNPEPIAGDMHFDDDEAWEAGSGVDLYTVALHEAGHALGLGHSDRPGSLMYPYYRRGAAIQEDDIAAIRRLYAARLPQPGDNPDTGSPGGGDPGAGTPPPAEPLNIVVRVPSESPVTTAAREIGLAGSVTGGRGGIRVVWTSDRGYAGTAQGSNEWTVAQIPLDEGNNVITITAEDGEGRRASRSIFVIRRAERVPPSIRITSPAASGGYVTSAASVTLSGEAAHAAGIARVTWLSSAGGAGTASGTNQWNTGPIALSQGVTNITVTAVDSTGGSASATLAVTRTAGGADRTAPSITILYPAASTVSTAAAAITLRGLSSDNQAVAEVTWSNSSYAGGTAQGTSNWTAGPVPLLAGTNTIVVRARDAAGNTAWRSVVVTRR